MKYFYHYILIGVIVYTVLIVLNKGEPEKEVTLEAGAEKIIVSNTPPSEGATYLGRVIGVSNKYSGSRGYKNEFDALNLMINNGHKIGADYIHLIESKSTHNRVGDVELVTNFGNAYKVSKEKR
jgi:hypothetical protein